MLSNLVEATQQVAELGFELGASVSGACALGIYTLFRPQHLFNNQ